MYMFFKSLLSEGDGKRLASIGLDDDHSIVVWNWKKGEKLATARAHKDKLFMIKWNPLNENQLLTVGMKHIKFWNQVGKDKCTTSVLYLCYTHLMHTSAC